MTNAKIVQLAKILTAAANSDMRAAKASLKRNVRAALGSGEPTGVRRGYVTICGTHKGNMNVEVDSTGLWYITCGGCRGQDGDFIMGAKDADARAFLIDCYVLEEAEAA